MCVYIYIYIYIDTYMATVGECTRIVKCQDVQYSRHVLGLPYTGACVYGYPCSCINAHAYIYIGSYVYMLVCLCACIPAHLCVYMFIYLSV